MMLLQSAGDAATTAAEDAWCWCCFPGGVPVLEAGRIAQQTANN
jgi:hypothetical protein